MDIESLITWSLPWQEIDHSDEEALRVNAAICEFSDSPTTNEWFKARGYTLCQRDGHFASEHYPFPESFHPIVPSERSARATFPYPHHNRSPPNNEKDELLTGSFGKIWFAQDRQGRHVVVNLVPSNSDELRVYELIRDQILETLKDACILPVLDILPMAKHSFVVMPRWGYNIMSPVPQTLREVLKVLHSMLKGMNFLHSHNIVHRDVALRNVLVNHYSDYVTDEIRRELRSAGQLSYAFIDYDLAVVFPPGASRSACRLPRQMSFDGSWPHPDDAPEGVVDYDPFAFDVGCMGILFCTMIQSFTGDLPFLAPLLDGMTARDPLRRFTVEQALQFFEHHFHDTSPEALSRPYRQVDTPYFDEFDRWSAIPVDLAEKWAALREPIDPASQLGGLALAYFSTAC